MFFVIQVHFVLSIENPLALLSGNWLLRIFDKSSIFLKVQCVDTKSAYWPCAFYFSSTVLGLFWKYNFGYELRLSNGATALICFRLYIPACHIKTEFIDFWSFPKQCRIQAFNSHCDSQYFLYLCLKHFSRHPLLVSYK